MKNLFKRESKNETIPIYADDFLQRWIETATWLEFVIPQNGSKLLRSRELEPDNILVEATQEEQGNIIIKVLETRRNILKEKNIPLMKLEDVVSKGHLLITEFNNTVTDGASEAESNCFIDIYDIPPWDTWLWLEYVSNEKLLYTWVPLSQINYVQGAIDVNCVDIIHWASEINTPITHNLRQLNLLRQPNTSDVTLDYTDYDKNSKTLDGMIYAILNKNRIEDC
ncbi:hypothetical protein [Sporocytophaga myxococcoides]|uniref:hypothetical protein n=1 Tax=Sporocytophaga myxococcoides TaxID=153721 RepID=UPI0012DD9CE5|nr:hypothetical protein [Sporocytophaga myxococcoides]